LIDLRPPSVRAPGITGRTIDEHFGELTLEELELYDVPLWIRIGEIGRRYGVEIESRFYSGGAWSSWKVHRNGLRRASRIQVRATLWRESYDLVAMLEALDVTATL
jgi:hypothetical protein